MQLSLRAHHPIYPRPLNTSLYIPMKLNIPIRKHNHIPRNHFSYFSNDIPISHSRPLAFHFAGSTVDSENTDSGGTDVFCVRQGLFFVVEDADFSTDGDSEVDVEVGYHVVYQVPFVLEEGAVKTLFCDTLGTAEVEIDCIDFILDHLCGG